MISAADSFPTCFPSETRIPIDSCEELKSKLEVIGAIYKGSYAFTDTIYKTNKLLQQGYWRLRAYTNKGSWSDCKEFQVTEKIYNKLYKFGVNQGFSERKEAEDSIPCRASCFSIARTGDEYQLKDLRIFVEQVDKLGSSVEIVIPITIPEIPEEKGEDREEELQAEAASMQKKNIQKVKELVAAIGLDYSKRYSDSLPIVYASKIGP